MSVIVPAYNYARFLPACVESVLQQTLTDWECLIVDDGSTDDTRAVAQKLAKSDERVSYQGQHNRGLSAARNIGFQSTNGSYVQFLDADDLIAPSKLEQQVEILESDVTVGVSYSNYRPFDSDTGERLERFSHLTVGPDPVQDFLYLWERGLTIPPHAPLFRRSLWPDGQPFVEHLSAKEDWVMWTQLALRGTKMRYLDEELALYRMHGANMTADRLGMASAFASAALEITKMLPAEFQAGFIDETVAYLARLYRHEISAVAGQAETEPAVQVSAHTAPEFEHGRQASLRANPNPIEVTDGSGLGQTTLVWESNVPNLEIHVGEPDGPLFVSGSRSGEATTGKWVQDGTRFLLQDATDGRSLTAANTLAAETVGIVRRLETADVVDTAGALETSDAPDVSRAPPE
ncbi:MAG: glycosyltransferase family 2 protein [Candidatus Limnocylindrales bacterium]